MDVHRLRPEQWAEFRQQKPDATMLQFREIGVGLEVAFNTAQAPFDELNVRRAAMLSVRPNLAIDEVWQGAAYLTQGVPLASAGWQLDESQLEGSFGDPPSATALLSESVGSLPVPVVIRSGDFGEEYRGHAERIASEMQSVGFAPSCGLWTGEGSGRKSGWGASTRCSWGRRRRWLRRTLICLRCCIARGVEYDGA